MNEHDSSGQSKGSHFRVRFGGRSAGGEGRSWSRDRLEGSRYEKFRSRAKRASIKYHSVGKSRSWKSCREPRLKSSSLSAKPSVPVSSADAPGPRGAGVPRKSTERLFEKGIKRTAEENEEKVRVATRAPRGRRFRRESETIATSHVRGARNFADFYFRN